MKRSIALCYDLKDDYLALGYTPEQVMEMDDEEVVAGLETTLRGLGHHVERVGRGTELARRLVAGERWDLVFNITEGLGGRGREAQVPALCELFGQPCTFSDAVTCGVTLDKAWAKRVVRDAGIATAPFTVVRSLSDARKVELVPPLFVKPLAEGSSMGVSGASLVRSRAELMRRCMAMLPQFPAGLLVESFLPGREFTVGVVGNGDARVVAVMEVLFTEHAESAAYTALNKGEYLERVRYRLLRSGPLASRLKRAALAAYRALECRDTGRVDLRCDAAGEPCFIELNPLPGLHPVRSDLPIMARLAGVDYPTLLDAILGAALRRIEAAGGEASARPAPLETVA